MPTITLEIEENGVGINTSSDTTYADIMYGAMVLVMDLAKHVAEEEGISELEAFNNVLNFIKQSKKGEANA